MDIDGISIKMLEETVEKDDTVYVWLLDDGTLKKTPLSKILELVHTLYSEREAYRKGLRRIKKRYEKLSHQNAEEIVKKFCETTMYKENQALVSERDSLKKEVEEYEATFDIFNQRKYRKMFVEEWKEEYQKELDKQGEGVIAGFPDADYVYKRYFEQKAEIEQLTDTLNQYISGELVNEDVFAQQVKDIQQAVKDTAQEALEAFICKLVNSRLVSTKDDLYVEMLETKDDLLKVKYSVEVE